MQITIDSQILSGNLGDGWIDNNAAAIELAAFSENLWRAELQDTYGKETNVNINIDVLHNTEGASKDMSVSIADLPEGEEYDIEQDIRCLLDEERTWGKFLSSKEAEKHIEEE